MQAAQYKQIVRYGMENLLDSIFIKKNVKSRRVSSWDKSGGNADWIEIRKGETAVIADIQGCGCIRHIWMTINCIDQYYLRKILLKVYWDNEEDPSVLVPIGDFFGVGHGVANHYSSAVFNMVANQNGPQERAAMNCFLPMPFMNRAKFEIVNEANTDIVAFYYYIDYEECDSLPDGSMQFHASWHREKVTKGSGDISADHWRDSVNLTGDENYVILDAQGAGTYVGCNISIDHLNPIEKFPWFGEGDDMIFIDGAEWPPALHGTGTEDYFCAAWGFPSGKYDGLYHGVSLAEPINGILKNDPWQTPAATEPDLMYSGKWTFYRLHLLDPITFEKSIKVTIEHGHANCHSSDYASTAYWYQFEPHQILRILPVEERLPRLTKESLAEFVKTI